MPKIRVRDINIYYELHGKGPRKLLFNAGAGGDLRQRPAQWIDPLSQHFQVLAWDVRGTGQTDKPDQTYSMEGYTADANALLDALGWEKALVHGVSFGGGLSHEFAMRYPKRVERVGMQASAGMTVAMAQGVVNPPRPNNWANEFDLPIEEHALRIAQMIDTRQEAAWFKAHPQEAKVAIERMKERLLLGKDEPGHDLGYQRQLKTVRTDPAVLKQLPALKMPVGIFNAGQARTCASCDQADPSAGPC